MAVNGKLDIIPLPGHPGLFARRVAVQAWQSAGSPPVNSAGRLYAEQKRLWDGWRLRKPGFSPADNPDDESEALAHVRFVAFDIDPTAERIRRLTAAGLHRPYTYEPWHWELPNVHSYALVRSIPATASLGVTPISTKEQDEMAHFDLIKGPDGTQWWCVDRAVRYAIPSAAALATYKQFHLELTGKTLTAVDKNAAQLDAYGSPVYANPLERYATDADVKAVAAARAAGATVEQIVAAVKAILPTKITSTLS